MLKITLLTEGEKLSLKLEGHAGYAEPGKDIVCASASILAYTLATIVENHGINTTINLTSGNTTIECECTDHPMMDVIRDAFNFANVGYALLAHNYPQYVEFINDVEDD
jgi:uncharacterized protein YsxB (DUF464 family)